MGKYDDEDNKIVGRTNIQIFMTKELKEKMDFVVSEYPNELGGYLTYKEIVEKDGQIKVVLNNLLIPYQKVGKVSVVVEPTDLIKMRNEYQDECIKIIGHFHSHNDMGEPYFSGQDEEMMKDYAENKEFVIFIIGSKHNGRPEYKIRQVLKNKPYEIVIENVPYECEYDNSISTIMKEEIEKKVSKEEIEIKTRMVTYNTTSNQEIKNIKKEIAKRVIYLQHQNHKVRVEKIFKCYADFIAEEFKTLNPVIQETPNLVEHYDVIVELGDKNKALEFMVDVKKLLIDTLVSERTKAKAKEESLCEENQREEEEFDRLSVEEDFEELELLAEMEISGNLDLKERERLSELRQEYNGYSGRTNYSGNHNYGNYGYNDYYNY